MVHEGDSIIYVELAMQALGAEDSQKESVRRKIDCLFVQYEITLDQWGRLYNLLNGRDPEEKSERVPPARADNQAPVFPTIQTVFERSML